jgi:hypothetical protein
MNFSGRVVRPERVELPTFWFPPPADSIQLRYFCGRGYREVAPALALLLRTSRDALRLLLSRILLYARRSMGLGLSSIL